MTGQPVLTILNVVKRYQGLRPLRLRELVVTAGERVALHGFDQGAAEVLVNLVTGASLPDEGEVAVLGRPSAAIADGDAWLASLERFGIVTPRAVLLDAASIRQNLAMPFTLDIEPIPPDVDATVSALAAEVGLDADALDRPVAGQPQDVHMRAHFARAIALDPGLLILEHPTAALPPAARRPFGEMVARVAAAHGLTTVMITEDSAFADAAATRRLALNGATGELKPKKRSLFGF